MAGHAHRGRSDPTRIESASVVAQRLTTRRWYISTAVSLGLVLGLLGGQSAAQESVQVATETGVVEGTRNRGVAVFKGIPYAAPPVGPLRWQPPQPASPWEGLREAHQVSPMAPQRFASGLGLAQSEDCLYLNIWTPAQDLDALPVMVWIHGGGFGTGSGAEPMYESTELAKQGVVVVTFNYRLNVLRFFTHPLLSQESPHAASGNYGLLDQIAVLEWVQRNIAGFGGDPDRVTIFGESAGGRAVSLLMASPLSRGLFHRAAAQSGALRGVSTRLEDRERRGRQLAEAVGCTDTPDPLVCLRATSYQALAAVPGFDSGPIVDGWVIPEDPRTVYAEGRQHDVPMMIGGNADEGTFSMLGRLAEVRTVRRYGDYVRDLLGSDADEALAMYPATKDTEVYMALSRFATDRGVARHAREQARWMDGTSSTTYVYHFSRDSPHHQWTGLGATHTAELPYLFGNLQFAARNGDLSTLELVDRRLSQAMMRYWTHFAATGDPNTDGLPVWPAFTDDTEDLLDLGAEIAAGHWPRPDGLDLLDRLFDDNQP